MSRGLRHRRRSTALLGTLLHRRAAWLLASVLLAAAVWAQPSPGGATSAVASRPAASATTPASTLPVIEPLSASEAPDYMRHLGRELRVLVRDTPIEVATRGEALRLTMPAHWLFRTDDVALRPEAAVRLDALALALAAPEGLRTQVEVSGHSDSLGPRELNEAFTRRRAEAIATLLAARGVSHARLTTHGAGEKELREKKEDSPAARQRNRRIELEIRPLRPSPREAS